MSSVKERLITFYAKHNPEKIRDIDKILISFAGKEDELISALCEKYEDRSLLMYSSPGRGVSLSVSPQPPHFSSSFTHDNTNNTNNSALTIQTQIDPQQRMDYLLDVMKRAESDFQMKSEVSSAQCAKIASTIVSLAVQLQYSVTQEREELRLAKEAFQKEKEEFFACANKLQQSALMGGGGNNSKDLLSVTGSGARGRVLLGNVFIVKASALTTTKKEPGVYSSLSAAVAECRENDTIQIYPGRYLETVTIEGVKNLQIIGMAPARDHVVIGCEHSSVALRVVNSDVTIKNMSVIVLGDDPTSIAVADGSNVKLVEVDIQGGGVGACASGRSKLTLDRCSVKECAHVGVAATELCSLSLSDTVVCLCGVGCVVSAASLHLRASEVNRCIKDGIMMTKGGRGIIEFCSVSGNSGSGLVVEAGVEVMVSGNTIQTNKGYGVVLPLASAGPPSYTLLSNNIRNNAQGDTTPTN
eukprot:PhF_6_TR42109/c0_g1_i1/m.63579